MTDHQALTFLFQCRLRNARLTRWTLLLQEFDLRVKYIPSAHNVTDALSRNPIGRDIQDCNISLTPFIYTINSKTIVSEYNRHLNSFKSVLLSQRQDPNLLKLIDMITNPYNNNSSVFCHYCLVEGVLFYCRYSSSDSWLVCIPSERINELIVSVHCHFGHVGAKKCILAISEFCFFKSLQFRVRQIIKRCDLCQRSKISTTRVEGIMQSVLSDSPLDRVLVDIFGPLPFGWNRVSYIFVVLDNFSLFVRLYAIKKATAISVTNRITDDYIPTYDTPKCIISDYGVQFTCKVWKQRLSELGIAPTTISVYHPQSNPAERVMRELGRMFRM